MSLKNRTSYWSLTIITLLACVIAMTGRTSAQIIPLPVYDGYDLIDLGANLSGWNFAYGINNYGQVTGEMQRWDGANSAFRTQFNQPIAQSDALGFLLNNFRSSGLGIDNNGAVVGSSTRNSPAQTKGFRWGFSGPVMEDLHPTTFTANNSLLRGMNDYGWTVGNYTSGTANTSHALVAFQAGYVYSADSWIGSPFAADIYDINNLSQFVGWKTASSSSQPRAFMFDAGASAWRGFDINPLAGGFWNAAYAINESGQVVGESDKWTRLGRWTHAFLFRDANRDFIVQATELIDLDTQNSAHSSALAINGGGAAVGYSGNPDVVWGNSRAMLFANGTMTDLNGQLRSGPTGWLLRSATGINDSGQIVGWMETTGTDVQARVRHAFRLDPHPVRRYTF